MTHPHLGKAMNFEGIRFIKVNKSFYTHQGRTSVIEALSFSIQAGEFIGIYGPNGVGKTTLLYIMAGLTEIDSGVVEYLPNDYTPRIGFVFQDFGRSLFNWLTVLDNVAIAFEAMREPQNDECAKQTHERVFSFLSIVKSVKSKKESREQACQFLEELGFNSLLALLDRYPYQLSAGQKQMVALARAMAGYPELLLLDEPFNALDAHHHLQMRNSIEHFFNKHPKATIVFVTHELDDALLLADRLMLAIGPPIRQILEWTIPFDRPRCADLVFTKEFLELRAEVMRSLWSSIPSALKLLD